MYFSLRRRRAVTLGYLLTLYASLGLVRPAAEFLRNAGLLRVTVVLLLASAALALFRWRSTTSSRIQLILRLVLTALVAAAAWLIPGLPEEKLHFLTYGLLGWLVSWSMEGQKITPLSGRISALLLVWAAGGVDELIQWYLPDRVFDLRDIVFNAVAGTAGILFFETGRRQAARGAKTGGDEPRT